MQTADDHGRVILSAIIPDNRDLLDEALRYLVPEHFVDSTLRMIYVLLERYVETTRAILPKHVLVDVLQRKGRDVGTVALVGEVYDSLAVTQVAESDFRWSLEQIRELAAERETERALTESMEILRRGATDEHGERVQGHQDARGHVLSKFALIDRELAMQDAPEGNIRDEASEMLADYAARKEAKISGHTGGVLFGVPSLDAKIGGLQPGELDLLVGYSASGKTSLACGQLAWSAAVEQGLNVVIATTETLRVQVRRKILARHSRLPKFGLENGLNSRHIKDGSLEPDEERVLREVIADFSTGNYGKLYIAQVPRGAGISTLEARLLRVRRQFPVDLLVIDYLALLRSERRRESDREELGSIIKAAKQLATTFDDGRGVPVISPWQVNRSSKEAAAKAGMYTTAALAETAEATNSSDVIVSLLEPEDNTSRFADLRAQVLKNRDGETHNSIPLMVDYATSMFRDKQEVQAAAADGGPGGNSFESLLGLS